MPLPIAICWRQIAPGRVCSQNPKDSVKEATIVLAHPTGPSDQAGKVRSGPNVRLKYRGVGRLRSSDPERLCKISILHNLVTTRSKVS